MVLYQTQTGKAFGILLVKALNRFFIVENRNTEALIPIIKKEHCQVQQ